MPKNRFPDSLPKRELRRQDRRRLAVFQDHQRLSLGLDYCGMPSVEFLDVIEWQGLLRSICAVEQEKDVLSDMRIQWDRLGLRLPIRFVGPRNILEFLRDTDECYDVYNLDFYGGFLHPKRHGRPRCVEAITSLISRQAAKGRSFVLVVTFNVRDKGVGDYLKFIAQVPRALAGWDNVNECCKAHKKNQVARLKLCFPFFCCQVGMTHNFVVNFADTIMYQSSVSLVHFYAEFLYDPGALPSLTFAEVLADLASRPLLRLNGMIPEIDVRPPQVTRS